MQREGPWMGKNSTGGCQEWHGFCANKYLWFVRVDLFERPRASALFMASFDIILQQFSATLTNLQV